MALCIQCDKVPVPKDRSRNLCKPCTELRNQAEREAKARRTPTGYARFWKVLHYKGTVLGLVRYEEQVWLEDDDGEGSWDTVSKVTLEYVGEVDSVEKLPKGKDREYGDPRTIDLDHFCKGFNKHQVRNMKRAFERLGPNFKRIKKTVVSKN